MLNSVGESRHPCGNCCSKPVCYAAIEEYCTSGLVTPAPARPLPCLLLEKTEKKRFKPEGSEKFKEVNHNIKRCMKKTKENWIGEQCSETEENLRKNNSKRAYLTTVKQGKSSTIQDCSGRCLTEEREN